MNLCICMIWSLVCLESLLREGTNAFAYRLFMMAITLLDLG